MSRFEKLYERVVAWGDAKGILREDISDMEIEGELNKHEKAQVQYGVLECTELLEAIIKYNDTPEAEEKLKDALGDTMVTQIGAYECFLRGEKNNVFWPQDENSINDYFGLLEYAYLKGEFAKSENPLEKTRKMLRDYFLKDHFVPWYYTIIGEELSKIASYYGLDILDCLEYSLEIIEKRTGKVVNGVFVKDGE